MINFYKYISIIFLIILSIFSFLYYKQKKELSEFKEKTQVDRQNLFAEIDSLKNTFHVVQLPGDTIISIEYIEKATHDTLIDTAFVFLEDTNIIKVNFSGKWKKGDYAGFTRYFKSLGTGNHYIEISSDSVVYTSKIFFDENKILKNQIYGNGNLLNVSTQIDEEVYKKILKDEKTSLISNFKLIPSITIDKNYNIGLNAKIGYKQSDYGVFLFAGEGNIGIELNYEICYRK